MTELFLPAILSRAKKRNYADYVYERTTRIFASRQALIDYEAALKIEAEVDELMNGGSTWPTSKRSSAQGGDEPDQPLTRLESAQKAQQLAGSVWKTWNELLQADEGPEVQKAGGNCLARFDPGAVTCDHLLLLICGLGHVYTRILHKGADALGLLKASVASVSVRL